MFFLCLHLEIILDKKKSRQSGSGELNPKLFITKELPKSASQEENGNQIPLEINLHMISLTSCPSSIHRRRSFSVSTSSMDWNSTKHLQPLGGVARWRKTWLNDLQTLLMLIFFSFMNFHQSQLSNRLRSRSSARAPFEAFHLCFFLSFLQK